ncbi:hypothetical protein J3459_014666 [Metarhizium acridum]|nr:hypothetical protein J3459_014666 [Metarhizium acridum]
MALSTRAQVLSKPDPKFFFWEVLQDIWDPQNNPNGFVNLGVAENVLMHDILSEHMHRNMALPTRTSHMAMAKSVSSLGPRARGVGIREPGRRLPPGKPYYGTFVPDVTLRMGTQLAMVDFDDADPLGLDGVLKYEDAIRMRRQRAIESPG